MGKRRAPLAEPPVVAAAEAHDVTPGQVILRWHVQLGSLPIPKSSNAGRQRENLDVFGFELSALDMADIEALDRGHRTGSHPDNVN
jgi:diketogulonate reductase-like aldo/keto reductase